MDVCVFLFSANKHPRGLSDIFSSKKKQKKTKKNKRVQLIYYTDPDEYLTVYFTYPKGLLKYSHVISFNSFFMFFFFFFKNPADEQGNTHSVLIFMFAL